MLCDGVRVCQGGAEEKAVVRRCVLALLTSPGLAVADTPSARSARHTRT